jgi:DNA-binding response OmpR family regulator
MKILIADTDTKAIEDVFINSQPDWQISAVNSAKLCLDYIQNGNSPDVVILGTNLSDIQYLDLIQKITNDFGLTIIVLSRDKALQTLVNSLNAGAKDYIVRPFNKAIFVARLKALVRRREWDMQTKVSV